MCVFFTHYTAVIQHGRCPCRCPFLETRALCSQTTRQRYRFTLQNTAARRFVHAKPTAMKMRATKYYFGNIYSSQHIRLQFLQLKIDWEEKRKAKKNKRRKQQEKRIIGKRGKQDGTIKVKNKAQQTAVVSNQQQSRWRHPTNVGSSSHNGFRVNLVAAGVGALTHGVSPGAHSFRQVGSGAHTVVIAPVLYPIQKQSYRIINQAKHSNKVDHDSTQPASGQHPNWVSNASSILIEG